MNWNSMQPGLSRRRALVAALASVAVAAGASATFAQDKEPLRIGAVLSMTGRAAAVGFSKEVGIRAAIEDINREGGILGRQVELVRADDQTDPTAAVNEARRLAFQEKVSAIMGPMSSQLALAVAPILTEAKVMDFVNAGAAELTPAFAPYTFSYLPDAHAQGMSLANYGSEVAKAGTVAIISDNGPNSKSLVAVLNEALPPLGVRTTGIQEFQFGATDMTPQLLALRAGAPDLLILTGVSVEDMKHVLAGMDEIGWSLPIAGSTTIGYQVDALAKIAEPHHFDNLAGQMLKGLTYCEGDVAGGSVYFEREKRVREASDNPDAVIGNLAVAAYDMVRFYKVAVEGAGTADSDAVRAWIENNTRGYETALALFEASPESHFLVSPGSMVMAVDLLDKRSDGLFRRAGC